MTNEEIQALRAQVARHLKVYHESSIKALDDLCKAARQPDSLVGKRCRTIQQKAWWPPTEVAVIADQGNGTYLVEPVDSTGGLVEFRGCDLELLGGTNA